MTEIFQDFIAEDVTEYVKNSWWGLCFSKWCWYKLQCCETLCFAGWSASRIGGVNCGNAGDLNLYTLGNLYYLSAVVVSYTKKNWMDESQRVNQKRQCTYNQIVRRVRVTIFAAEKKLLHIMCSLNYPEFKPHGRYYCLLWSAWQYHVFSHCLINCTVFGKTLLNKNALFDFV
jgi:hypothetical protein